jgi:hypothetical protein
MLSLFLVGLQHFFFVIGNYIFPLEILPFIRNSADEEYGKEGKGNMAGDFFHPLLIIRLKFRLLRISMEIFPTEMEE